MVMQARKLPRLSDGYFERNQSHSYENSGKFSKSNDRTSEKIKNSPVTTNSDVSNRNDVLENRSSPRYHRSCSQRQKDKDHHEDSSKSPIVKNDSKINKDFKSQSSCEKESSSERYHSNHDRNATEEVEKRLPVSDWSEHISSSGKKYYYNCKTEVSQWEKPKELIEWERQQNLSRLTYDTNRSKDRSHERLGGASGSKNTHSQEAAENSSENSDSHSSRTDSATHNRLQTTASHSSSTNSCPNAQVSHLPSPSEVTSSNLPKVISELSGTKGFPDLKGLPPQEALRTIQQALLLTKQVTNLSRTTDSHHQTKPSASSAPSQNQVNHHPVTVHTTSSLPSSTTLQVNSTSGANFPDGKGEVDHEGNSPDSDSSTHSVRHDSPTSSVSSLQSLNTAGTSSLATAALRPSIPSLTPSLANYYREDLISHVVGWQADHAERQGAASCSTEKLSVIDPKTAMANRYWEEAHNIGSLNCTQVSAELKMARALVRLAEIQATLQEQRILFLRQQTKELEEWRTLNSFMGDS